MSRFHNLLVHAILQYILQYNFKTISMNVIVTNLYRGVKKLDETYIIILPQDPHLKTLLEILTGNLTQNPNLKSKSKSCTDCWFVSLFKETDNSF